MHHTVCVASSLLSVTVLFFFLMCGNLGLSTLSPTGSSRGKDRGKSRKSIFGTAPSRCATTGELTTQSRAPGKGKQVPKVLTVSMLK